MEKGTTDESLTPGSNQIPLTSCEQVGIPIVFRALAILSHDCLNYAG